MPVCSYFTRGYCKFGGPPSRDTPPPYKLEKDKVQKDLTEDRPRYILSAYGPEQELPIQLFGGWPREQSFEELRLRHYELAFQGNQQQAVQEAQNWVTGAEQQIQTALNDLEGAIKYMINGENEHPNRIDICQGKGATASQDQSLGSFQQATSAFGQPTSTSGFGQPSSLGQRSLAFDQPQLTSSQPSAFGQPLQLGRPSTTFGQPSSFGQPTSVAPTFGQSSNQSSLFGQPTTSAPAFGQPSAPPAFGQGSISGQQSAPGPAFGAPSSLRSNQQSSSGFPQVKSIFGQPSAPAQTNAFGQSSTTPANIFGHPATPSAPAQTNAFGQTQAGPANLFGKPAAPSTTPTFGQTTLAPANPFVKSSANPAPSAFGQPSNSSSMLGQPPAQLANVFGQPSNTSGSGPSELPKNVFNPLVNTQPKAQPQQVNATYAGGRLTTWNGKSVIYVDKVPYIKAQHGELEKIHFPDGPPSLTKSPELPDELYDEGIKEAYKFMMEHGAFKDGIMPNLPPKREWCKWNF